MEFLRAQNIPNALTFLRFVLVLPYANSLLQGRYDWALVIFFVAAVTDALDGFIARFFNWQSRFGAIADPLADKLLLVTSYGLLGYTLVIDVWVVALIFGRDLIIVTGALLLHFKWGRFEVMPSIFGKICTFMQILFVLMYLWSAVVFELPQIALDMTLQLVIAITAISGVHYIVHWGLKFAREGKKE